jgi:alkanesulfonate monooxygenase
VTVEFIGTVPPRYGSELIPPSGPPVKPDFIAALARAYEDSLFDSVQIGQSATSVDAVVLAQAVLAATERLGRR